MTWAGHERVLLFGAFAFWAETHLQRRPRRARIEADQLLINLAIAGVLPHIFKYFVDRERPDRFAAPPLLRRGIPRSGKKWDSFPSGHAMHLGAVAGPIGRLLPSTARLPAWTGLWGLALTRVFLLAHHATDVVAGFVLGVFIDRLAGSASKALLAKDPVTLKNSYE